LCTARFEGTWQRQQKDSKFGSPEMCEKMTRRSTVVSLKDHLRPGRLVQNAIALMVSSGGTAVIGIVFWGVAARMASTAAVGRTTAELAAMLLLATLAQLSYGSIFERFLPVAGTSTRDFVARAYALCVGFAFILAVAYVLLGIGHRFLPPSLGWRALFVAAVVLWTIFALQDSVMIGLRASRWVAIENIAYSLAKLALLPLCLFLSSSQGIFVASIAPIVLTVIAVTRYLFRTRIPGHMASDGPTETLPSTRELIVLAGAQYTTLLSGVFLPSVLSLIVIQRLGAEANAYYFLPTMISTGLGLFCWGIVRSFLVEATHEPDKIRKHANSALRTMIVVLAPSVVIGYVFAPEYLRIFGNSYATHGTTLMRMLLLSMLGTAVTIFYSTFAWIDKRVWWMTARSLANAIVQLGLVFALIGHFGIEAIGIAAMINAAISIVVFLPISIRRYRSTGISFVRDAGDEASIAEA
jgi:O-antigen/teichoic acid export membrane protein